MKKSNIPLKNKQKKNESWRPIAISVIVGSMALIIMLAFILPIVKINSDFDKMIDQMKSFNTPEISITDMGAENVFGNSKGEVKLTSPDLVRELCELCEDFKYEDRDSNFLDSWDIRFRVKNGDGFIELFLDDDEVHYVKSGVIYYFSPKNDKTEDKYELFYKNIEKLLEKEKE